MQFISTKRRTTNIDDVEELSIIELLEPDKDQGSLREANQTEGKTIVPYPMHMINLTSKLTSHSFRCGVAMYTNDGSLSENWILDHKGWHLERGNKAYVLSGWTPKTGARLPPLRAREEPIRVRALKAQALIFSNALDFADTGLYIAEDVTEVLTAIFVVHYPVVVLLTDDRAFVIRMHEAVAARYSGELEVLVWSETIRRAFVRPPPSLNHPKVCD
ncbi:hypothetical protein PHMEG_00029314 [Phytophthora megakarya]|uniref:Uncharacterized protein n=1 Tax=Phytophthora megakarya TaxID=4795 RepID=A0A225V3J3_9STRA|nr:hypothetical protein PHMEG_00029314 [Phytophthora megakarya]